jgi:chemotaxis response regulator CheB
MGIGRLNTTALRAATPVVGVGASAGGLEVFKRLLGHLPSDSGLAIVFVQHLDPKHRSLLTEILARATTMPISEAANGMLLEANHVYVIPASVDLTIADGALMLVQNGAAFLHKPFTPAGLAQKVRDTLDVAARSTGQS